MTPAEVQAWLSVAQVLLTIGVDVSTKLTALIHAAHPTLTPEQTAAAYEAIMSDAAVRSALAAQASGGQ